MQLLNDYGYKNKLNIDNKTYLLNFNTIKKQIDINQIDGDIAFSFNENKLCIIFNQKLIIQCNEQEIKLDEIVGDNLWYDMESQVGIIVNEKPFKMKKFIVSEENGKLNIKFNLLKIQDMNVNELTGFKIQVIDNTFYLIGGWDEQFNMNQKMLIIKEVNKKEDIEVIKLNEWNGIVYPNLIINQQKEIILIGGIKNKEMELNQENYLINNQKQINKINNSNNNNLIQLNSIASYQFQSNNNYYLIGGYSQQFIKYNNLNYYQLQSNNQLILQSEANLNINNNNNNGFLTFNKKQIINSDVITDNDLSLKLGLGLGLSIGLLLLISFIYFIYKKKVNYRRPQFQLRPKKLNRVKTSRQSLLWDENNNPGNNNDPGNNDNNNNKELNSKFNLSKRLEPSYQLNKIE
ncbi:hypothetical protein K502DRAFT_366626 [Neoconidiobolus thromboides FSU 785]|nr:hypothetical protein K502DRAFT_366626 [Neoconidiobolus thromboides FSU 785]